MIAERCVDIVHAVSVRISLPFFLFVVILNLHVIPALLSSLFVLLTSEAYFAGHRIHTFYGPLPPFSPTRPIFSPLLFLTLETGPLNTANGSVEHSTLPSGVLGAAKVEVEFGAVSLKMVTNIVILHCFFGGGGHFCTKNAGGLS